MQASLRWIVVAHLVRPQGRKGEILAELHTDFPERFTTHPSVFLAPPGFNGQPADAVRAEVTHSWLPVGRNLGRIVLKFAGIDSISAAETILAKDVLVPSEELTPLDEDAAYIHELIGCAVLDGEILIGTVEDVLDASSDTGSATPQAAPLLLVRSAGNKEILIPYVKDFLVSLDLPGRVLHMRLPAGLVEINA